MGAALAGEAGVYDLAIIGGGINGVGIARDAQGRGLKVFLAEQGDLASGTSSASTKLIHGGLRYLEHYEFRLVREALIEREVLLNAAPHIIWPLRFVLPHHKGLRPWPVLRLGLFLYDHLGGRKILPGTRGVNLTSDVTGSALKPEFTRAFEYSDCWVNDARLVVLNARDAQERGADIRPRTRYVSARRDGNLWACVLEDVNSGAKTEIKAKLLINTGGHGSARCWGGCSAKTTRTRSAWSKAAMSWSTSSTIMIAATSSRTRMAASVSPFPMSRTSR